MDNQNQMDKILVYLDIERLRTKVIPGRDPVRYPPYVSYMTPFERHRFTMKCIYCHQTSPISDASLRDKLNSIDMFQTLNARLINHFPYNRYPSVTCPKCKRVILFPHWMQLIDRVRYVPTLSEGALEIGWMEMRNNYKDWEADGDHQLTEDGFYWIDAIALNDAYPGCWFPYTNKYLRELKIEYIRVGEMRISINDFHRLFTRRGLTKPYTNFGG